MIRLQTGLRLARTRFDVGLLTDRGDEILAFWRDERGLPVERTLAPMPGITQHRLTMHGAVLKVNCVEAGLPRWAGLAGLRLLRVVEAGVEARLHVRDPDGNQVQLVPPGRGLSSFGVHLAVSDEQASIDFYGNVLGFERTGERTFDVGGAELSLAWSPDVGPAGGGPGFTYLTLQVVDVYESHALVCRLGAQEMQPPSDSAFAGGSTVSFVLDPDGNAIELSQRPDLVPVDE